MLFCSLLVPKSFVGPDRNRDVFCPLLLSLLTTLIWNIMVFKFTSSHFLLSVLSLLQKDSLMDLSFHVPNTNTQFLGDENRPPAQVSTCSCWIVYYWAMA